MHMIPIDEMVTVIVQEIHPERVYLFGSRATGRARAESDLDLLVVEGEGFGPGRSRWRELQRIRKCLARFRGAKDILVYSLDEFEKWRNSVNHIISRAEREGKLLYERS